MQRKPKILSTVILLAPFIFSFAFALDVYIPVVPAMKDFFHTSQANIQLTLTLFMLISGIGQLIMGPVTDYYGRRPVILASTVFFILGSVLCAIANSLFILIIGRLIEAFGGCGMLVVAFAIVRDQSSGNESAKVYSFLNCGLAMSPLFAPIIGSYLAAWFNWRAGFIFLTLMGVLILIVAILKIRETHPVEKRIKINRSIFLRYWKILTNRTFIVYTFCTSAGLTVFFTFFSSSPYIVIKLLHAPVKDFGYYFFTIGVTFFIGSLTCGKVVDNIGAFKTALLGSAIMLIAGIAMIVWYWLSGLSVAKFLLPCMLAGIGGSFMMGAGAGGAMEPFAAIAGSAAALVGCLQFLAGGAVGAYVMTWPVLSTMPLAITIFILSISTLVTLIGYFFIDAAK